jgi:hypothetical protein
VGHKILIGAYQIMATHGEVYRDLGGDYFTRRDDPHRRRNGSSPSSPASATRSN